MALDLPLFAAISPQELHEVSEGILDEPEFRPSWSSEPPWMRWLELWEDFSDWVLSHPDESRVLLFVLIMLLVLLVGHMAYTLIKEMKATRELVRKSLDASVATALESEDASWASAYASVEQARDEGDLYRAVFVAHRLILALLADWRCLELERWKTNQMYAQEVEAQAPQALLERWNALYERVVYGHESLSPSAFSPFVDELARLHREGRSGVGLA